MADGCFYTEESDAIQKIFTQNFLEHYTKSKAPFPLFFHAAWFFNRPHRKDGFFKFIDSILALPDVYFVTSQELIAWTRYPEPLPNVMTTNIIRLSNSDIPDHGTEHKLQADKNCIWMLDAIRKSSSVAKSFHKE